MALSDKHILLEKKKGDIVINPYKKENLNTASYDVTLGEYFFREQKSKHFNPIYNPYNRRHTEYVWGDGFEKAKKAREVFKKYNFNYTGIKEDDLIILLEPGETILGHTREFIGGRNHITTQMQARSSVGRNFVEVCKCAGWGDVGYINRWTMEITNNSRYYSIPLVVGRRIAQIIFYETGEILGDDYVRNGKYGGADNIKDLKKSWKPEMMLPQMWKDREIRD